MLSTPMAASSLSRPTVVLEETAVLVVMVERVEEPEQVLPMATVEPADMVETVATGVMVETVAPSTWLQTSQHVRTSTRSSLATEAAGQDEQAEVEQAETQDLFSAEVKQVLAVDPDEKVDEDVLAETAIQ